MLFRDIPCDAAIARPDRPSARNCNTSFALIFRTFDDYSFRRAPYTHDGRSLNGVAPNNATTGTQDRYCALSPPAPKHTTDGPQKREYSIKRTCIRSVFFRRSLRLAYRTER
jgi:hypothetical protein